MTSSPLISKMNYQELWPTVICQWTNVLTNEDFESLSDNVKGDKYQVQDTALYDAIGHCTNEMFSFYDFKEDYEAEILQVWSNVLTSGQSHDYHTHPNSMYSGIFYLTEGVPTTFIDPRPQANTYQLRTNTTKPSRFLSQLSHVPTFPNSMVIFPSWLGHWVTSAGVGDAERKTISFNLYIRGELGEERSLTYLKV